MFASGLGMLWENTEPTAALQERFGLADFETAGTWISSTTSAGWGLQVAGVERILISDVNALAWVRADPSGQSAGQHDESFVVKVNSAPPAFARLDAVATLLGTLEAGGLPVAAPLPDRRGQRRRIVETDRPLSVAVHRHIEGALLNVNDLAAVHATGEMVGQVHLALAGSDQTPFAGSPREMIGDLRPTIAASLDRLPHERAPRAHARLSELLPTLPDLDVPPQVCHGDIRGANVLTRDSAVAAILDFDEVNLRHRVAEVALGSVVLATEFRRWVPAPVTARREFVAGYRDAVPLTDSEQAWLGALQLWFGLQQIPAGADPDGWAAAVEQGI